MFKTFTPIDCRVRAPILALFAALCLFTGSMAHAQASGQEAPRSTAVAGQPTPSISTYRINPGDDLAIFVWGEERLQRELKVLPDGTIAFPLVGQLKIAGLRPQDVERLVSERLRDQYRGEVPFVTVTVKDTAGMSFSIMGKVNSPGVFNTNRYIDVLQAISLAGGPSEFANLDNVTVIRGDGSDSKAYRVRLGQLFKSGVSTADVQKANNITIEPGDVIIVP